MPSLRPALDRSYHYPPDVLELLVDTIPRLIKSKASLLEFFEQAGTPEELIAEWRTKLRQDRMSVSKYHIARGVLRGLNALGDEARPVRHQVFRHLARHGRLLGRLGGQPGTGGRTRRQDPRTRGGDRRRHLAGRVSGGHHAAGDATDLPRQAQGRRRTDARPSQP